MVEVYVTREVTFTRRLDVAVPMSVPEDSIEDYLYENSYEFAEAVDENNCDEVDYRDAEIDRVEAREEASKDDLDGADYTLEDEWEN
jgi:hypothetical protein